MHFPTRNTNSAAPEREKNIQKHNMFNDFRDTKLQLFRVFWWNHVTVWCNIKTGFTRDLCVSSSCTKLHIFAVFDRLKVEQKCALRDRKTATFVGFQKWPFFPALPGVKPLELRGQFLQKSTIFHSKKLWKHTVFS